MKKKDLYFKTIYIIMLLMSLPLLWWTMELTSVPHNIVPNVVGSAVVPYVEEGKEYVQLGGWLGAFLYLVAAVAGGLGLIRFWSALTTGEFLLHLFLFLTSLISIFLLRELYWLTLFPLTLLSGGFLYFAWFAIKIHRSR